MPLNSKTASITRNLARSASKVNLTLTLTLPLTLTRHVFARPDGGRRTAQDLKDKWATLMREETRGGQADAPSF